MPKLKIGIIGAGATGLAAGYELVKAGHQVTLLEQGAELGGLAASVMVGGTHLERYYHHLFGSDKTIIALINELGLGPKLHFRTLPTGIFYQDKLYNFGTPAEVLSFAPIPLIDRVRFAASSALLKARSDWRSLERVNALDWTRRYAGRAATAVIWEPLLRGKFGRHADSISMAWLWARVHCRTFQLGYLDGGFDQVYAALAERITQSGGAILFNQRLTRLEQASAAEPVTVTLADDSTQQFDRVIATLPQPAFAKLIGAASDDALLQNHYLGATCFILELKRSLIPCYWLNINDTSFPFLAVVEHTKMIDKAQYGGHHVVYVGNYVPRDDPRFTTEPAELLKQFMPYLQRLNPDFSSDDIVNWQFSKAGFAQPIVTPEYHKLIPPHTTPLPGVRLATMAQVYPQDRGQNYAVQMGQAIAREIVA